MFIVRNLVVLFDVVGFILHILGEASLKKTGKIWDNVQIRVDPSPPSDIWDIFEFETFLKNTDPPIRSIWDIFEIETFLMAADPPRQAS